MRIAKDGSVRVSVPLGYPKAKIDDFIGKHQDWMQAALERQEARLQQQNEFYAKLPLESRQQKQAAKTQLDEIVAPLVREYSAKMNVKPSEIGYRASTSRWGSCNVKSRKINFSLYLLLLPDWCIEHVVVHELAHLKEPNHSPRFYRLMDKYFPRWKEAGLYTKKITKEN